MSIRKNMVILIGCILSVSLLSASVTAVLLTNHSKRAHFQALGTICQEIIESQPEAESVILSVLKEYKQEPGRTGAENILLPYGYSQDDLWQSVDTFFVAVGFLSGVTLLFVTLWFWHKKEVARILTLTDYLEKVNAGEAGLLVQGGEDAYSKLQDELYKTVTMLYQTRDTALAAKNNFAENLSNIAHQIKTPITSISLSAQMMKETPSPKHLKQIEQQLSRLTHLEEALLLLSRIDAGTLLLERKEVDVFTLLMLAADHLQELAVKEEVFLDIEEAEERLIFVDLDWTMEAIINLFKNCMEHTPPGGTVYCRHEQNPLYTQIRIWDSGAGFAKEDILHWRTILAGKRYWALT